MATSNQTTPIFSGESRHALDDKLRVTVPARWRRAPDSGDEFFVTVDRSGNFLKAMPPETFASVVQKLANKPGLTEADMSKFERMFYARSRHLTSDKQGRILLPADYCASVGIKKEVVLVGTRASFEIYNPDAWEKTQEAEAATFDRLAELAGL
jgi:MraZ protein